MAVLPRVEKAVPFDKQIFGYNQMQVDYYLEYLAKAYQATYNEYESVCERYNDLLMKCKKMSEGNCGSPKAKPVPPNDFIGNLG